MEKMNIVRSYQKVKAQRWARYRYNMCNYIGEGGKQLTSCDEHIAASKRIAGEGMVLIENDGTLPLKKGAKIALFGIGSIDFVKCGGGSGNIYPKYAKNFFEAFDELEDVSVYRPLSEYYYQMAYEATKNIEFTHEILKMGVCDEVELPDELLEEARNNADTAIIVIHRYSTEAADRTSEKGDFYLTDTEQEMIDKITAKFSSCVAILNVGGMIDVSWIKENPSIGAALLAWQPGQAGAEAAAEIVTGRINPSGKLTDTFAKRFEDYPSADTFNESDDYLEYFEDIFVGYRYFETIPQARDKVNYPFGYGLSYTTFEISKPVAKQVGENIEIFVSVKNTGKLAGKEVVQAYFSAPQGKLGKSAIELAAFKKTALLAPGEKEDITLTFAVSDMASYDDLGKVCESAYILEGGEYSFFVGNSCRNIVAADYRFVISQPYRLVKQLSRKCAPNKLKRRMLADGSFEELPSFEIKKYSPVAIGNTAKPIKQREEGWPVEFTYVGDGEEDLDEFMTQLTDDELIELVSGVTRRGVSNTSGIGGCLRLEIPAFMTCDGPAGVRLKPAVGIPTTSWPCATLLACTWEPSLAEEFGKKGAMEAKENGLAIWLTPALNIHRNPLCGRNFEYYSEDPLVSGKIAAAKVRGIQSEGLAATIKHFACNNKETNRRYSDSRVSERALREIYIRGFEICVNEADPWALMTAYNILNSVECAQNYELLQGILRDEWGFKGVVMSDWNTDYDQIEGIKAGNDVRMPFGEPEKIKEALASGELTRAHLEQNVRRVLEMFLKID